jgi:hypothetical protein
MYIQCIVTAIILNRCTFQKSYGIFFLHSRLKACPEDLLHYYYVQKKQTLKMNKDMLLILYPNLLFTQ